ncbi:hypothetical protein HHK36_012659 [Tetracentron sinense]|uniref:PHD-type domain-containing protein n=1 Tax=Tetracentron sinense TaxID=13715 RepID=A0A835DFP6_TETSI|nr:hypothetical protein HHK36_012659 [Tetracentron sinense]
MKEGVRSGVSSGRPEKDRVSSGCLIVRKKGDGATGGGASGKQRDFESKKDMTRPRLILSDSESEEDLLVSPRRRVVSGTNQDGNDSVYRRKNSRDSFKPKKELEVDRKRIGSESAAKGGSNKFEGAGAERKRSRFDIFEYNEDDVIDSKKIKKEVLDGVKIEIGKRREVESGFSRGIKVDKRNHSNFDRTGSLLVESNRGPDRSDKKRLDMKKDETSRPVGVFREKWVPCDEPIRVQGKNGVLKVMVNNRNRVDGSQKSYGLLETGKIRKGSRSADPVKWNTQTRHSFYSENKLIEKPGSLVLTEKYQPTLQKFSSTKKKNAGDWKNEDSDTSSRRGSKMVTSCGFEKEVRSRGERTPTSEILLSTKSKEGAVKRGSGTEKQLVRDRIKEMLLSAGWTIDSRPRRNRDYQDSVYISLTGTAYWSVLKAYDALQKQFEDEDVKPSGTSSPFTPIPEEELSKLTRQTRKKTERELKRKQRDDSGCRYAKGTIGKKSAKRKHGMESTGSPKNGEKLDFLIKRSGKSKGRMNENDFVNLNAKGHAKSQKSTHLSHGLEYMKSSINEQDNSAGSSHKGIPKPKAHLLQGRKTRKQSGCALLVRSSNKGKNSETGDFIPYSGKRTVLSWMIDSGTVHLSEKVQYMNRRRTRVMLEGWITRDGIHCGCCSKILTVSKFEIHAGSKLRQPFQNIYVESGSSLLQCQLDAWNRQEESERSGFHSIDFNGDDPNDDTCGLCGDGGDLICCDGCPSTFHQCCLDIKMLPPGDWHCLNCSCKFCGIVGGSIDEVDDSHDIAVSALLTCSLCEEKFDLDETLPTILPVVDHQLCIRDTDAKHVASKSPCSSFCGQKCQQHCRWARAVLLLGGITLDAKLFEQLQKLLGVKHELEAGFSWTLIQRFDVDSDTSLRGLPQRAECNSKLAVALTVMDECFLPIIDRRSGINLIHNVLYNCGSNFNRLNYSGFYTAILERGDEIISAASIRIHGTRLAEMPFIGTRHIYRRQGMCRRLLTVIESALCSLNVEKLIIPAISELMHTWTVVFGFKPLEESHKREMKSMNMLVFPGTDLLQKLLLKLEFPEGNMTASADVKPVKHKINHQIMPKVASKSEMDSSAGPDMKVSDEGVVHHAHEINDAVAAVESGSQAPGFSVYDTSEVIRKPLDASHGSELHTSNKETVSCNSQLWDKLSESATNTKCVLHLGVTHDVQNKSLLESPIEINIQSSVEGAADDAHEVNAKAPALCSVHEISPLYTTVKVNGYQDAVSGSNFLANDGSSVQCNSDLNQRNICEVESKSSAASHFVSDATHCEENILEGRGSGACEIKTEDAAAQRDPDCYDEGSVCYSTGIITQPQDAAFEHGFQRSGENMVYHNSDGASLICRDSEENIKSHGSVSEHNPHGSGEILVHCDSQLLQKVSECAFDATDMVLDTREVANEVVAVEHNSQALGQESVACASEMAGESLYAASKCVYPTSVDCKVVAPSDPDGPAFCGASFTSIVDQNAHDTYDLKDEVAAVEPEFHSLDLDSLHNQSAIIFKSSEAIGSDSLVGHMSVVQYHSESLGNSNSGLGVALLVGVIHVIFLSSLQAEILLVLIPANTDVQLKIRTMRGRHERTEAQECTRQGFGDGSALINLQVSVLQLEMEKLKADYQGMVVLLVHFCCNHNQFNGSNT